MNEKAGEKAGENAGVVAGGGIVLLYFAYVFMLLNFFMSGIGAGSPSEADVSAAGGLFHGLCW